MLKLTSGDKCQFDSLANDAAAKSSSADVGASEAESGRPSRAGGVTVQQTHFRISIQLLPFGFALGSCAFPRLQNAPTEVHASSRGSFLCRDVPNLKQPEEALSCRCRQPFAIPNCALGLLTSRVVDMA